MDVGWTPPRCNLWPWKRRYDTTAEAYSALLQTRQSPNLRNPNIEVFRCQSSACGGYHLGHPYGASLEYK